MKHYVDKDALVAEIKRRLNENSRKQTLPQYFGMVEEDLNILSFIDDLEVNELNWKPSDEQMETLENVRKILHTNDIYSKANNLMYNFEELIRTLKKLREK